MGLQTTHAVTDSVLMNVFVFINRTETVVGSGID